MKTKQTNAVAVQNGEAKAQETQSATFSPATPEENKAQESAPEAATQQANQQPEPNNMVLFRRPVLGLDATLKLLDQLHRESIKRANLLDRISLLEEFEVTLMEEADELECNHFQGCRMAIFDSKGRQFTTNTSGLIKIVAEFVKSACYEKLAEIEANIVFPQAA
jgi:hypothetical protein